MVLKRKRFYKAANKVLGNAGKVSNTVENKIFKNYRKGRRYIDRDPALAAAADGALDAIPYARLVADSMDVVARESKGVNADVQRARKMGRHLAKGNTGAKDAMHAMKDMIHGSHSKKYVKKGMKLAAHHIVPRVDSYMNTEGRAGSGLYKAGKTTAKAVAPIVKDVVRSETVKKLLRDI